MTKQEVCRDAAKQDSRIKELSEENELLCAQLSVLQDELEKKCRAFKESAVVDFLAENQKLRILAGLWRQALGVERRNSLASRLGNTLIQGVRSAAAFLALPGTLRGMWKAQKRKTPPDALGGMSFRKVLEADSAGGPEAVEKLLDSVFLSSAMRADAYTALARHLKPIDRKKAAENARLAYETDPRPTRLKRLAFRMYEAADAITADAMLDMLSDDIALDEAEQRKAARIRRQSAHLRKKNAAKDLAAVQEGTRAENQKTAAANRREEEEGLRRQQAVLQKLADDRAAEAEILRLRLARLEKLAEERGEEAARMRMLHDTLQRKSFASKFDILIKKCCFGKR